jgi:hypothetical protein
MVYLKVLMLWMTFEMMSGLEACILCCIALVEMIMCRLRLWTTSLSTCKPVFGSTLTAASDYSVENLDILALLLDSGRPVVDSLSRSQSSVKLQSSRLINVHGISITKFHELSVTYKGMSSNLNWRTHKFLSDWQQICCVFNEYLRKYYCGTRKISLLCKKLLTSA